MKIKPKNHKKVRKQRTSNRPPVDVAFRQAINSNKRKNGMVKIGAIIDEILVTRNHKSQGDHHG